MAERMNTLVYKTTKAARVGIITECPCCGGKFLKRAYQQTFCSNKGPYNCKDRYWNEVDPERKARAMSRQEPYEHDEHPFSSEGLGQM